MSDTDRYYAAMQAMQAGVKITHAAESGRGDTSPVHLRVGVNAAMCDHAALVRLLMAKGLFTIEEYNKYLADEMEAEKKRYEDKIGGGHTNIRLI